MISRAKAAATWLFSAKTSSSAFAHTLSARLLLTGINFTTGVLVARSLEAHGRGVQAAMSLWPMIISALFTLGMPNALRYYVSRDPEKASDLLSTAVLASIVLGALSVIAGTLFIPYWLSSYGIGVIHFAQLMMLFSPGILLTWVVQAYLEATADFKTSNSLVYLPAVLTLACLALLAGAHRLSPFSSSIAYLAPTTFLIIPRLVVLRRLMRFRFAAFRLDLPLLFTYGVKAFAVDVLTTLSVQVDQTLVIKFLSATQLGVYTVALAVSRLVNIFSNSLNGVLLPKASAMEPAAALPLVIRAARITLIVNLFGALLLSVLIPIAIPLFYGHAFRASIQVTQILLVEVSIGSTVTVLAQAFLSTGRPGIVAALQGVGLLATVPFMILAIPRFGLIGAALALLASTFLRLLFVIVCFPLLLKCPPPSLLITIDDVRFVYARAFSRL